MTDERTAAEYAAAIAEARQRLIGFIEGCPADDWLASPLDGDPRPVGIVVDHVAHSYEYIENWLRQILAGQAVEVSSRHRRQPQRGPRSASRPAQPGRGHRPPRSQWRRAHHPGGGA